MSSCVLRCSSTFICVFVLLSLSLLFVFFFFFFFNDTATTEIYTLSLPTLFRSRLPRPSARRRCERIRLIGIPRRRDRKSTRLNSSHRCISYAVFCLKKKRNQKRTHNRQRSMTSKRIHNTR